MDPFSFEHVGTASRYYREKREQGKILLCNSVHYSEVEVINLTKEKYKTRPNRLKERASNEQVKREKKRNRAFLEFRRKKKETEDYESIKRNKEQFTNFIPSP